ncbi:MAG: A/G-specific adenine glycosylase [Christensenellales bacterium]
MTPGIAICRGGTQRTLIESGFPRSCSADARETVVSYYERFLARYPDVYALAGAPEEELLKAWEGLGYYSRARSLQKAAKLIVSQHGGELPADLEKLRALPGIRDYTSGAIASIAFGIPAAAVDGNVERVVCRYFALSEEMGSPKSRRMIHDLTQELVPPDRPGAFANAMMEMGATMCTPKSPACLLCPVRENCKGHARELRRTCLSSPEKSAARRMRCVMLVFLSKPGADRSAEGAPAWRPFRLSDAAGGCRLRRCARRSVSWAFPPPTTRVLATPEHVFTHLIWEMEIHAFAAESLADVPDGRWVSADELAALPMPTAVKAARRFAADTLTCANA